MNDQRFCPNCGSRDVEPDFRRTNVLGDIIADQNKWICNDCNYSGWMPEGEKHGDEGEKIEFDQTEQPEIDTDLGIAYRKFLVYIMIPLITGYVISRLVFG